MAYQFNPFTGNLDIVGAAATGGGGGGNADTATKLLNARTFEITGDVVASPVSFDGTANVSLAATIQPNSVGLGTDTFGDYVRSISGTANAIDVTGGTGEGSTPVISFAANPTINGNVTIGNDLQINNNLNVTGNITVGGTTGYILVESFRVSDADAILGFTTDSQGNDVSNDTTANHGGIAIASTEGNPLVNLNIAGIETLAPTYKKIMWFKAGAFAGLNTDAWLVNYAIGIGSTQFPSGTRLAAGSVQFTENDLAAVRNINASGTITAGGDVTIPDKIVHSGDTDTAIRFPASNEFSVETGGAEAIRVDPFGRLLIGLSASSSSANTVLQGNPGTGILLISRSTTTPGTDVALGRMRFSDSAHDPAAEVAAVRDGGTWTSGVSQPTRLEFSVTPNGSSATVEGFRINSSGAFGLNGANFGTTGQVLTSNGSAAAPTWEDAGGGGSTVVYYNRRPALHRTSLFYKTAAATLSIVAGSVLNGYVYSTATAVTMPSHSNNTDYAIWQHPTTGALVGSSSFTSAPVGATGGSIVGGYHYIPAGRPTAFNNGSPTGSAEILEYSLWDLTWRPSCPDPRGMSCIDGRFWADIYLCGNTSYANTTFSAVPSSRIGLTIADDNSPPRIPGFYGGNGTTVYTLVDSNSPGSWYNFAEVAQSFGKRLMFSYEAQAAFFGAPEETSRGTDPGTVQWERASKWGLSQATGVMWAWAADRVGIYAGVAANVFTGNRGIEYADNPRSLAVGGSYDYTNASGSRGAAWLFTPYNGAFNFGARFAAEHVISG